MRTRLLALPLALAAALFFAPSAGQAQRLIAGLSAEGGGFVGESQGIIGGAGLRLGFGIGPFELYAQHQGFVGALSAGPESGSGQGLLFNSLMLGLGLGPFHIAAGPSLDFAWGCSADQSSSSCYRGDWLPGLDVRAAIQVGHLALSVNVHPTLYGSSAVTALVFGAGWEY